MPSISKILPFGLFLLTFIVFLTTLAPDVMFTDSGELAAVCLEPGIAHPTGYPLFTIVGYLWSKIPLPLSPIGSLNLMAAFFVAISSIFFYKIYFVLSKSEIISTAGTLSTLFSSIIWYQATSIEVYSLHTLMVSIVLYFALVASRDNNHKYYLIAGFFLGLSFANHLTTILLIPALLYLYFKPINSNFDFSKQRLRYFLYLILALFIGLSLYLYLPIRSAMLPDMNWGWVHRGWDKFIYHVQGKQYQVWMFSDSAKMQENFINLMKSLPFQTGVIGLAFVIISFFRFKKFKYYLIFAVILFATTVLYSINYSIHDIDSYFISAIVAVNFLMVIGLTAFLNGKQKYFALAIPIIAIALNYSKVDESENRLVDTFTKIAVENLEPNAIIISSQWDYWNAAFWYKKAYENLRPDVILIEKELLRRTWYPMQILEKHKDVLGSSENEIKAYLNELEKFESEKPYQAQILQKAFEDMINSFIDKNISKRPVYLTLDIMQTERNVGAKYEKSPQGFAFKLSNDFNYKPFDVEKINIAEFEKFVGNEKNHLEEGIVSTAAINLGIIGQYSLYHRDTLKAKAAFQKALKLQPNNQEYKSFLQSMN